MAQLQVEPKKNNWLWPLLAIIALALLFFLYRSCNSDKNETMVIDSAVNDTSTAVVAATPDTDDWSIIDRNAPSTAYDEVTDKEIEVRGNDQYAIYSLDEAILFDSDQNTVKTPAVEKLQQIAASAEKRFAGGNIRVYGYTDSEGSANYNKELAQQRAEAVKNWMVQNGNIPAERISTNPVGEAAPVASNATEAGKAMNRRVEIVIRKK